MYRSSLPAGVRSIRKDRTCSSDYDYTDYNEYNDYEYDTFKIASFECDAQACRHRFPCMDSDSGDDDLATLEWRFEVCSSKASHPHREEGV
jgi:hypothetical protein